MLIKIPVSAGELVDKITILEIKKIKIKDKNKLNEIKKEHKYLKEILIKKIKLDKKIKHEISSLKKINLLLWNIEDGKRAAEGNKEFGKKLKDDVATQLFVPTFKKTDTQLSEKIRKDIDIILREITPYNFQLFMNNLNVPVNEGTKPTIIKFYNKLLRKDIISTTVWYILTIILVTTINMNTILGMPCDSPIKI